MWQRKYFCTSGKNPAGSRNYHILRHLCFLKKMNSSYFHLRIYVPNLCSRNYVLIITQNVCLSTFFDKKIELVFDKCMFLCFNKREVEYQFGSEMRLSCHTEK